MVTEKEWTTTDPKDNKTIYLKTQISKLEKVKNSAQ